MKTQVSIAITDNDNDISTASPPPKDNSRFRGGTIIALI